MSDLLFVAIMLVFFLLAGLFVRACDRVIGADEAAPVASPTVDTDQEQVAA